MGQQHTESVHSSPIVTGTIEWPTIKNTRVTLFDLMDHLKQGLPPHFVAHWYHLALEEMDEAMQFLKAHEAEIERAYAAANARAAAQRRYWEARNRHVLTSNVSQLPLPSHADTRWLALRDTLLAAREKCVEQPNGTHTVLIDHNIEGFAPLLPGVLAKEGWIELLQLQLLYFSETTLQVDSDDTTV